MTVYPSPSAFATSAVPQYQHRGEGQRPACEPRAP